MTEEETAAKLKARVDRWQAYIQQSKPLGDNGSGGSSSGGNGDGKPASEAAAAAAAAAADKPAPTNLHWLGAGVGDTLSPPLLSPPTPQQQRRPSNLPVHRGPGAQQQEADENAAGPETDAVVWEARVAELREAVEHEREQARRLADSVTRQQALHAMSLHAQAAALQSHRQPAGRETPGGSAAGAAAFAPKVTVPRPPQSSPTGLSVGHTGNRPVRVKREPSKYGIVASLLFFVILFGALIVALLQW